MNDTLEPEDITASECSIFWEEIERKAVMWLVKTLQYFDPLKSSESERMFARKAILELSLLVAYRVKIIQEELDENYLKILEHVELVASRPSYRELIARDHRALLLYGLTYAALKICGRDDPYFRSIVKQALDSRYPGILERIPYRQLDFLHFLYIADIEHKAPAFEDIFPFTLLAGVPNAIEIEGSDIYAITHTIFYITDFGLRTSTWSTSFDLGGAIELVTLLMSHFRICGNADIVAELIISSICLGVHNSHEIGQSCRFIQSIQNSDGRVPGPSGIVDEKSTELANDPSYKLWKTSYHTTIVVALAALMARHANNCKDYPVSQSNVTVLSNRSNDILVAKCRSAFSNSVRFLCESSKADQKITQRLRAAAGLAIVTNVIGSSSAINTLLIQLADQIDTASKSKIQWSSLGSDTMLIIAYVFKHEGITSQLLESKIYNISKKVNAHTLVEFPATFPACVFLAYLGKIDCQIILKAAQNLSQDYLTILSGESAAEFSTRLLTLTGGDPTRFNSKPKEKKSISEWLASELIHSLKDYNIGNAAMILRMLLLLGQKENRVVFDAIEYILSQQNPDGAFGYFANDLEEYKSLPIRLTWTLGTLWALADFAFPKYSISNMFSVSKFGLTI